MDFDAGQLDERLIGQDSEVAWTSDFAAERYLQGIDSGRVTTDVRRLLSQLLPAGQVTIELMATRLNRSVSTLQRELRDEGTTFTEVLDQTRRLAAQGYLAEQAISLSEIAYLLGFSDESSFSRAFRRWTGLTPNQFRDG